MALLTPAQLPEMMAELDGFEAGTLPDAVREAFVESRDHVSPVVSVVRCAELLYSVRQQLSKEGLDLAAQLASFAAAHGWHQMAVRGTALAAALQRQAGHEPPEGSSWPAPASDPAPSKGLV